MAWPRVPITCCTAAAYAGISTIAAAGALTTLPPSQWAALNDTVAQYGQATSKITATKGNTAINPDDVMKDLTTALQLFQNNSVFTLGQVGSS